ncbi:phage tail length tape measure family protein [Comamonas odontotermitis]|uniref:phage tail length tape measure family protein n=1 Tax=Comamonas odontotermitis TaxID=379895 RepID=UPI0021E17A33|nr:phage tail length tape measure family protein [Comamonas odontotermitis]
MALQQLPLQFQDIFVSLQGGQAPLTVLLQQGSQIVGSFGGVGAAAKAMSGYILGLVNPFTVAGAAVGVLGLAYYQGSQEADNFRKILVLTGNQAGTSVDQLSSMAKSMAAVVGTQGAAAAGLAEMAQKSKVGSKNLQEFTASAILWEKATGQAVAETAKQFAELAKDPLKASMALNEQMNFLTADVYKQIRALDEQGKTQEAAEVAQRAYSNTMKARQAEITANLGVLERGWKSVGDTAKKAWDKMLDVGRPESPLQKAQENLTRLQEELEQKQSAPLAVDSAAMRSSREKSLENLKKQIEATKALLSQMQSVDSVTARMAADNKSYIDASDALAQAAKQGQTVEEKRLEVARQLAEEYKKAVEAAKRLGGMDLGKVEADYARASRANNAANQRSIDRDAMLDAVARVESGGRQTDRSGNVVTSSVGALGMYQIMPASGPHMAQLAGVEWSKARLEQGANYGRTLASAYIEYLMRSFDGDAVKALTAYHSGKGNVDKAIAKAGVGGDWLQNMGPEGQKYAGKVLGQFTTDAQGNYNGLVPGVALNKEAIATQQKIREMQDATAAATASMAAQQAGYNKIMADFIGMKATEHWKTLSEAEQKALEQDAIAKSNADALMQSHQALEDALKGADAAWQDYGAAISGVVGYTKEMAAEQARYDKVMADAAKNGLSEETQLKSKEEHLRTLTALREKEAGSSAASLARQADQLEETNKHYGKSAIVIGEMTAQRLKDALAAEVQANGYSDLAKKLEAQVTQQQRVNAAMSKAELNKALDTFKERTRAARESMAVSEQELQLMGLSGIERAKAIAQLEAQLRIRKDIAELERKGLQGAELATASEAAKTAALEEAQAKVQQAMVDEWKKTVDQYDQIFSQGFADMLNNGKDGWKSFTKSLTTTFKTTVADQIYRMFIKPIVVNLVGNLMGMTGGSGGGAVGQMASSASNMMNGGMTNWTNMGTAAADWMWNNGISMVNNGFTSVGGAMMDFSSTISNVDTWFKGIGLEGGLGSAVGYLGSVVALAKGDYGAAIGSAIGTYILPGIGTMIGSWLGSAIGGLFGRKLKESGIEGEFGGESGFEGRLYKYYKGGLFRSNKTTYEDMPEEMRKGLGDQFLTMDKAIRDMAGAVGLSGEALDGFTAKFKVDLKDLSPEEATKKLQEEFQKIAEQMGGLVLTSEEYTRAGETQLEALTRLSGSITLANEWFKAVGDTLFTVGLAGADMASELIDAFGGADKFLSATSKYYDKFFSDEEKVANQTRLLQDALKKLGVDAMPMSRQALRDYINSIDVSTEAGRKLYAALIGMADAFDVVYSAAEQAEAALRSSQEAYYDKFYSDAENQQRKMEEVNKTFEGLGLTVPRSREEFRKMVDGIDRSTEAGQKLYKMLLDMSGVFDELYTASDNAMQQMVDMLAEIAGIKDDLTLDLLRAQGNDAEATRREREKKLAELEKYKDPSVIQLQKDVWAAQDKAKADEEAQKARDAAEAAAQKAYDAAYAMAMKNLQGAVGREKEYWDKFVSDAKTSLEKAASFFTLVTNAAASLRDPIEDVLAMQAAAGMVYIENALERARQGLGLPDYDQTDKAINAASSGLVMDYFGSQVELDYEKKVLAGQLDELGKYADTQKTDAEKLIDAGNAQIERLDGILDFWNNYGQESIDATLSVADAVNAMAKLVGGGSTSTGGGSVGSGSSGGSSGSSGGSSGGSSSGGASLGGSVAGSSKYPTIIGFDAEGRAYYSDGSRGVKPGEYDASGVSKNAALSEDQWERLKAGQSVYDGYWLGGKQYGLEMYDWDPSKQMYVKRPSFDVGTNFVPYDMKANLHAGERVIPRADNKALIAALEGGGNAAQLAEVVAELREVKAKLAAIEENTGAGASFGNQTAEILKEVTEGGNAMRTLDMADAEPAR